MFQLPQLSSLNGSLPHERRHSDGPDSTVKSSYGRVGSIGSSPSASMRPPSGSGKTSKAERRRRKSESMAKKSVTKASELMYLVPHNKEEAKQYKSVLVFCDVKLKEGASRRRNSVDKGPDVAASAACCHVLDTLCDAVASPQRAAAHSFFSNEKIVTKLRDELLVALYSDYVEPTTAPPYLQRVPYHQLASQLRQELGDMAEQVVDLQKQLAASKASRAELEDMVLAARVAKLDTEKQLADQRQKLAEQDQTIIRLQEDAVNDKSNLEHAEDRCSRLASSLEALENEVASYSTMKTQLEDSTQKVEALLKQMSRQGNIIKSLEDERDRFEKELMDSKLKNDAWQKQVQQMQEQLLEAAKYMPAPGEGPRPTTPRPDWAGISGPAVSDEMRESLRKGSTVQCVDMLYAEMERLHERLEGDPIPCSGLGDDVPAHLRWEGTVQRQAATIAETRARVADIWQQRIRKRSQDRDRKRESEPFAEFVAAYFKERISDKKAAAQASYNLHIDIDRHGGPPNRLSEPLSFLTARVLHDEWSEGVFDDLHEMLRTLFRSLVAMPNGKDGPGPAKRDVNAMLEDFFPGQPEPALNDLRNALTKDCPGSTIPIDILFDGGLGGGNGSEFIGKVAELYVKNTSAALSAISARLAEMSSEGKVSLAQAKEAFESLEVGNGPEPLVGICGGEGVNAVETVARGAARAVSAVTGPGNDAVDVEVKLMLERLIGTGPVRSAKLYTTESAGGGAAGSGAAASKPALA